MILRSSRRVQGGLADACVSSLIHCYCLLLRRRAQAVNSRSRCSNRRLAGDLGSVLTLRCLRLLLFKAGWRRAGQALNRSKRSIFRIVAVGRADRLAEVVAMSY